MTQTDTQTADIPDYQNVSVALQPVSGLHDYQTLQHIKTIITQLLS
jgi:hypothetical protein